MTTPPGMEYSPADPDTGSGLYFDLNLSLPLNPANTTTPLTILNGSHDSTPLIVTALKSTAILFVIIAAIFGNILVIISVFKFKNLRIISNVFIMSLAFADLLVAVLVMPFSASQEIVGHWVFSVLACDIFNANDVLFSNASLLHLCCISIDRYVAITDPFHYKTRMTRRKVALMLSCAWGASALISHIPVHTGLYTTEAIRNATSVYEGVCVFDVNQIYAIISSTISFWVPTFIMVFTYVMIFREARRQEKRLLELTRLAPSASRRLNGNNSPPRNGGRNSTISSSASPQSYGQSAQGYGRDSTVGLTSNGTIDVSGNGYQNNIESEPRRLSRERNKMKREHKAAKTLGIIMGCFLLCWLPFFLWYVITTICGDETCPTPPVVISMLFWIGYFNSALNPMIYAFFNKDFRNAFRTLLRCQQIQDKCQTCCSPCQKRTSSSLNSSYYTEMASRSTRPSLVPSVSPRTQYKKTYESVD